MNAILTRVSRSALEIPHGGVEGILGMFQMQERSLQCTFFKTLLNYSVISVSAKLRTSRLHNRGNAFGPSESVRKFQIIQRQN